MSGSPSARPERPGGNEANPEAAFTGDLLLLLRLAISDAPLSQREAGVLRRVAAQLGVPDLDAGGVFASLDAFGLHSGPIPARLALREDGQERRKALAKRLLEIAKSDPDLFPRRQRLAERVVDILGICVEDCLSA